MTPYAVSDVELEHLASMPVIARDAWCLRRNEELEAAGALPTIPAAALAALQRNHDRYTWTGDVRG